MDKQILYAKNIPEVLTILKNTIGVQVIGGCTRLDEIPDRAISTIGIKELCQINRHERYISIGPGVTMNELLEIGENHLPPILWEALNCISNPIVRNMATIGGNICSPGQKLTLYAPLIALDTRLDFKSLTDSYSEPLRTFKGVPEGYILTDIRIPLEDFDLSIFRRLGPEHNITEVSASYAFMAKIEKNSLTQVELAFAGPFTFYNNNLEDYLIGRKLPLSQKDLDEIEQIITREFEKTATDQMLNEELRQQFFNMVRYSLEQMT